MSLIHKPVLLEEVVGILNPMDKRAYLDCTVGGAGHALSILESSKPDGYLIGIDTDKIALKYSKKRLSKYEGRFVLVNDRYENLSFILENLHIEKVDGILIDLGLSSLQIDDPDRGFSFKKNADLDMRFSKNQHLKASDIVNDLPYDELQNIIHLYGEERWSKRIAKNIVIKRSQARIESTLELSEIIKGSIPRKFWSNRIDVSTKTFQAIRIAVNHELEKLDETIRAACDRLNSNGRLIVISYHSLEDRIVKNIFKELSTDCICPPQIPTCICKHEKKAKILTFDKRIRRSKNEKSIKRGKQKFLTPEQDEIKNNPRSRSAKLRALERI